MAKIEKINTVHDYNAYIGQPDEHPLVSVIDYEEVSPTRHCLCSYGIFGLFLMEEAKFDLAYGSGRYLYKDISLMCVAPGQIGGKEDNGERCYLKGWVLLFHPEMIRGTFLGNKMRQYSFFSYNVNEALHMTPEELELLVKLFKMIKKELRGGDKDFRDPIIVGLIDVVLQYCMRFYNRQFSMHKPQNNGILARFEQVMNKYYDTGRQFESGLPTVSQCASELCLSTNYFADLVKKFTGETAGSHIHKFIINRAKSLLVSGMSVSQAAYELGFEYPQHLSRLFKKIEGITPSGYVDNLKSRN